MSYPVVNANDTSGLMDTVRQTEPVTRAVAGAVLGMLAASLLKKNALLGAAIGAIGGYVAPGIGK